MKTLIATVALGILFALFFLARPRYITTAPTPISGVIYDVETATVPAATGTSAVRPDLPRFTVYAMARVPEEFIVRTIPSRTQADYILMTEAALARTTVSSRTVTAAAQPSAPSAAAARAAPNARATPPAVAPSTAARTRQRPADDAAPHTESITPQDLRRIIAASRDSYYYPERRTGTDVVLTLVSRTPHSGRHILRFRLSNRRNTYVFIAAVALEDAATGTPVDAQPYYEQYVAPGGESEGYVIAPRIPSAVLKLTESGGTGRCLEITFSM